MTERIKTIDDGNEVRENNLTPLDAFDDGHTVTVSDLFALVKRFDNEFNPLPSSAVRNEDGTPKKMYRGDTQKIMVFGRKKSRYSNLYGKGFYFTDSESHAKQHGNVQAYYFDIFNCMFILCNLFP